MMKNIIALHQDIFFFLILILVFVSRILVRALWHFHYQKNPILQRIVHGTTLEILFRLIVLFFSFFFFTICLYYGLGKSGVPNSCIGFCDGRNSSPSMVVDLNPPQPGEEEAVEFQPIEPPAPVIPELNPPLMGDMVRRWELQQRLPLSFLGRNDLSHLSLFLSILEKQIIVEKSVDAARVHDRYHPLSILARRHEIRGFLFYPRGTSLSDATLTRHIRQIELDGTRESIPYQRIARAIRNHHLWL